MEDRSINGWLMYLRKSRQDDPNETVAEVVEKHERRLQELAVLKLGGRVPEENIYREVVSGAESIDERIEIKKVLTRLEDENIKGVLFADPQRLSRGSLTDCDRIIMTLQYTHSLVLTQMQMFDLSNKMERRYFTDELMRGRDYLDYIKETLRAGNENAARRGCYIGKKAPFGYNRVKIGKDWTLEPNEDADTVRLIFSWYVKDGLSTGDIAYRLEGMGVEPAKSEHWNSSSVERILANIHYAGKVRYNFRKKISVIEDGTVVKKEVEQSDGDFILVEGKQPALVSQETFDAAQNRAAQKARVKQGHDLNNVLAGVLRCAGCGRAMRLSRSGKVGPDGKRYEYFYTCPAQKKPGTAGKVKKCHKSAKVDLVLDAVIFALEQAELPKLQAKLENGDGDAAVIQTRRIDTLTKQLAEFRDQEDTQYELLEKRKYTQEVFDRRNAALRTKMEACEKEIFHARQAMPKNVDYGEKIIELQDAIQALRDPEMPNENKNRLLRTIVERIEYSSTDEGYGKTAVHLEVFLRL